ncbi:MAG: hypothetical protein Q8S09_12410 [Hyphomonas sp.]|nr:hypothetical protein [Hyphomonas sp.]
MSEWCDDCAWPEACAMARECARREAGEIRAAATPQACDQIRSAIARGKAGRIIVHDAAPIADTDEDRRRRVIIALSPPRRRA